jgi:uncharacterized protein (TIGR00725 family)
VSVQVAVVGPAKASGELCALARQVGAGLAARGAVVVTGGLGGVMEAACDGARAAGGLTVGLLPGDDRTAGNAHLEVVVPTGLGQARNALVVAAADVVVSVGGSWGTFSEVALARRRGTPVVALAGWTVLDAAGDAVPGVQQAADAEDAVVRALGAVTA